MEAAFLKTETSAYLHNVLTDFEEIRHGDATRLFKPCLLYTSDAADE